MSRKPYIRKLPSWWWLAQGRYVSYMVRELTCIFIGAYTAVVVFGLWRLSQGREAYDAFVAALQSPFWVTFHVLAIFFALFHMVTWFGVAPKAMPLRIGEKKVSDAAIVVAHYAVWIVVSAAVLAFAGVG